MPRSPNTASEAKLPPAPTDVILFQSSAELDKVRHDHMGAILRRDREQGVSHGTANVLALGSVTMAELEDVAAHSANVGRRAFVSAKDLRGLNSIVKTYDTQLRNKERQTNELMVENGDLKRRIGYSDQEIEEQLAAVHSEDVELPSMFSAIAALVNKEYNMLK
jgi:hypothetical protein